MSLINKILGKLSLSFEEFIDEYINSKIQLQLEKKSLDFNLEKTKTIIDDVINTITLLINNLQNVPDASSAISKANTNINELTTFIINNPSNIDIHLITAIGALIIFNNIEPYITNITSSSFELVKTLFNNISNLIPEPNIVIPNNRNIVALSLISIISSNSFLNITQNITTFITMNSIFTTQVNDNQTFIMAKNIIDSAYGATEAASNLANKSKNAIVHNSLIQTYVSKASSDANTAYIYSNTFIEGIKQTYTTTGNTLSETNINQIKDMVSVVSSQTVAAAKNSNKPIDSVWLLSDYSDYAILGSSLAPISRDTYIYALNNSSSSSSAAVTAVSNAVYNTLNSSTPKPSNNVISSISNAVSNIITKTSKNDDIINIASVLSIEVTNLLNNTTPKPNNKLIVNISVIVAIVYASTVGASYNNSVSRIAHIILSAVTNSLKITNPELDNEIIAIAASIAASAYSTTIAQTVIDNINNFSVKNIYPGLDLSSMFNLFNDGFLATSNAKNYIDFMVDNYKCILLDKNVKNIFVTASNICYNVNNVYNNSKKFMYFSQRYNTIILNSINYFNRRLKAQEAFILEYNNSKNIVSNYLLNNLNNISSSIIYASNSGLTDVTEVNNAINKLNNLLNNKEDTSIKSTDYLQPLILAVYIYLTKSENKINTLQLNR